MSDFTVSGGTNTSPLVATFEDMRTFSTQLGLVQEYLATESLQIAAVAAGGDLLESAILSPATFADAETKILQAAAVYLVQTARVAVLQLFIDGAVVTYETVDSALATAADGLYFVGGFAVGVVVVAGATVVAGGAALYAAGVAVGYQVAEVTDSAGAAVEAIGDQVQQNPWLLATVLVPGDVGALMLPGASAFASAYSPADAAAAANRRLADEFAALLVSAPDADAIQAWAREHTDLVQTIINFAPGLLAGATFALGPVAIVGTTSLTGAPWPPLDYDQLLEGIIAGGGRFGVFDDATGQPTVAPIPSESFTNEAGEIIAQIAPTDLSTLFLGAQEIDANGDPNGDSTGDFSDIRLVERVAVDGVKHWIVQIPSTQNWGLAPGIATNDLPSDLASMAQHQTVLMAAVKQAMEDAGVTSHDPVMFAGFSLGGITAGLMSQDPWMNQHYNITNVVTAGASIGNFDIPSDVNVLSFEHTGDLVPAGDGSDNPATTNQVTVHADAPMMGDNAEPHNAVKYAVTAGEFQGSGDPNAGTFTTSAQGFFTGGDVTVHDYKATR
ncbi:hypothetical protein E3O25_12690 [Cryobacterium sp. TMT1-3]|uniref:Uncharacterized protein n=1 Tax=Cryobacterium luteum TaxID=1424661 RepID=A0A1H8DXR7_9MICO|nr:MULTISPECIES: hypothetical protein [Cryobacterium]TFB89756.1 hypothetical protein E3O10_08130 [Cryobacterium luteum]TFC25468.1 hypothetical protein E3O25_12690 [Cryobacterium sp. TMT1-3]SEN12109.1 hypothetical protein SAMN05216281_10470 [Cryobacterium luteum]